MLIRESALLKAALCSASDKASLEDPGESGPSLLIPVTQKLPSDGLFNLSLLLLPAVLSSQPRYSREQSQGFWTSMATESSSDLFTLLLEGLSRIWIFVQ